MARTGCATEVVAKNQKNAKNQFFLQDENLPTEGSEPTPEEVVAAVSTKPKLVDVSKIQQDKAKTAT